MNIFRGTNILNNESKKWPISANITVIKIIKKPSNQQFKFRINDRAIKIQFWGLRF